MIDEGIINDKSSSSSSSSLDVLSGPASSPCSPAVVLEPHFPKHMANHVKPCARAQAVHQGSSALPRFPMAETSTSAAAAVTTKKLLGGALALECIPHSVLFCSIAPYLEVSDLARLFNLSLSLRKYLLKGLKDTEEKVFMDWASELLHPSDKPLVEEGLLLSESLSPSKFNDLQKSLGLVPLPTVSNRRLTDAEFEEYVSQWIPTYPRSCTPNGQIQLHTLTLGSWFNRLTSQDEKRLWALLSQCRLEHVSVSPEYYECTCNACQNFFQTAEQPTSPLNLLTFQVDYDRNAAANNITPQHPPLSSRTGSPGRTPYRRTRSAEGRGPEDNRRTTEEDLSSPPGVDNNTVTLSPTNNNGQTVSSFSTSLQVFSGGASSTSNSPNAVPNKSATVAKKHAVARIFWLFRLLISQRSSIKYFDFCTPPSECRTCDEEPPPFPLPLRRLQGTIQFPHLEHLRFGKAIDCRYVVPFIDFSEFAKLRQLEILGLTMSYQLSIPQFGREPTLVFGPQFIFNASAANQWLPAVYNGRIDSNLQLQSRGVYASREYHYEGSFKDGRNEGFGQMASHCGETYIGEWKDGRRHGQGLVTQADGRQLRGTWKQDSLDGRGSMKVVGGLCYEGEWSNGLLGGWGVMSRDGVLLAFGQFYKGRPHGWVVHRADVDPSKIGSDILPPNLPDVESWEVPSFDESPIDFEVESDTILSNEPLIKSYPAALSNFVPEAQRISSTLHMQPGWKGVWKKQIEPSPDEHIILFDSSSDKQGKIAHIPDVFEIEEEGPPPISIAFWLDDVLKKLII